MRARYLLSLTVGLALLLLGSPALAATVTNGGFETGTFSGWTVDNQAGGSGNWYVYSNGNLPSESCSGFGAAAPPEGTFAATSDQSTPGSHVLYQDIALETNAKHTLSFTLYYHSRAGFSSPPTLDYTTTANQQYRVDVMKPSADPFSVASSDILETLFQTTPTSPTTLSPTTMTFDLSSFAGQTVRLRFAEVDNRGCFLASVDDVKVASTATAQTGAATNITLNSATLNGTVNPDGQATTYHFEYGTSTSYGSRVPASDAAVGSDSSDHPESQAISGLAPNTTYHFRIVATNASGTTSGVDMTFTTPAKTLKLTVSPRATRAGQRACFSFRTTSSGHAVSGATIHFHGHLARTSSTGRAMICVRLSRGTYHARAAKHGFTSARATVIARAPSKPPTPKFTG